MVLLYLDLISIVSQHTRMALVSDDYVHCRSGLGWTREEAIVVVRAYASRFGLGAGCVTAQADEYASRFYRF